MLLAEGRTLILTTHYMDEAQRLCDRVAIMDHGRVLDLDAPASLIRRHIEPHVVEVHGSDVDRWFEAKGRARAERYEKVGETLFCYARDERAIVDSLGDFPRLQYAHRPANLEDVFLKLTGRELRE
jgi:lipooligosaccharide transport system ATP-binding protein